MFLAIVGSNLDEFFMKRIGGLKQQVGAGVRELTVDGRTPQEQIDDCALEVRDLLRQQRGAGDRTACSCWRGGRSTLSATADLEPDGSRSLAEHYFREHLSRWSRRRPWTRRIPFPFISNLSLNLLVTLRYPDNDHSYLARIKVPVGAGIPRFLRVGDERTLRRRSRT